MLRSRVYGDISSEPSRALVDCVRQTQTAVLFAAHWPFQDGIVERFRRRTERDPPVTGRRKGGGLPHTHETPRAGD